MNTQNKVDKGTAETNVTIPAYTAEPLGLFTGNKTIADFLQTAGGRNIDKKVVDDFGEEWSKFHAFDEETIRRIGDEYFDILPAELYNRNAKAMDMGCGTGRWTKYLCSRMGFVDAVDPSKAIFVADRLLKDNANVRLTKASSEGLPFKDNEYDLVVSIGVLHHIPDTLQAMKDCVAKVKTDGYFYTYLYYSFDNRGPLFRSLFGVVDAMRKIVSRLPGGLKKGVCDLLAVFFYMPFVLTSRLLHALGLRNAAEKVPLSYYRNKPFFIVRNDALDRFGTTLEQRFSREQIKQMMEQCGLSQIRFSDRSPYWHVIGKKA